jgi:hypothetical protein
MKMHALLLSDTLLSDIIYSIFNALATLGLNLLNWQIGSHPLYIWLIIAATTLLSTLIAIKTLWHFKERLYKGSDGKYHIHPRELWNHKNELLCNEEIRLKLGNPNKHIKERKPNQKNHGWAWRWLTPYAQVFHSAKHDWTATVESNKHFDIYSYIIGNRRAPGIAKKIRIEPAHLPTALTEILTPEEIKQAKTTYYKISINATGKDRKDIEKLEPILKTTLGNVKKIELLPENNARFVEFRISENEPPDLLERATIGKDYLDKHPALFDKETKTLKPFCIGMTANGQPYYFDLAHSLAYGSTGSGKGSYLQSIIYQLAPQIRQGTLRIYGIDPKSAELLPYQKSTLFSKIILGNDITAWGNLISQLHKEISNPLRAINPRKHQPTRKAPTIILFIDEMFSLLTSLQKAGKDGQRIISELETLLALGRSKAIFVIGATQFADRQNLGYLRGNIQNWIILRISPADSYYADTILGKPAMEAGNNPCEIPRKGGSTAGIGYATDDAGEVQRIRLAYISDDNIDQLIKDNSTAAPKLAATLPIRPNPGHRVLENAANRSNPSRALTTL